MSHQPKLTVILILTLTFNLYPKASLENCWIFSSSFLMIEYLALKQHINTATHTYTHHPYTLLHTAQHSLPCLYLLSALSYCLVTLLLFIFPFPILLISFSRVFIFTTNISLSPPLSDRLFLTESSRLWKQARGNVLWVCLLHPVCLQREDSIIN